MFYDVGLLLIFLSICMNFYNLGAFRNAIYYAPSEAVTDVALPTGEENADVTLVVKEALKNAEQNPKTREELEEKIKQLSPEKQNDINDIISTTNFSLTTDDVAIIALLTAFLAVINGPGGAITFGAFLTIAAGLDSKYSETAQDLLKKIPSPNPQDADATALEKTKENQTAVG